MGKLGNFWCDKEGFTTPGVAIALLLVLALIFSSAQVYRIHAASQETQSVADAAALAAMNEVGEFVVVVRVCDAVVLSLSLTGLTVLALGVVALCVPATAGLAEGLIETGKKVLDARDAFADQAQASLNNIQCALPLLAAANAASVAAQNGSNDTEFRAITLLAPMQVDSLSFDLASSDQAVEAVDASADSLAQAANEAEEAAERAWQLRQRAWEHDCGLNPSYCMYERAESLAELPATLNPYYASSDAWSFSVALARAQAYYPARLAQEAPASASLDEQAKSALRKRFYEYAVEELKDAFVLEDAESFKAHFPLFPKNTEEMKASGLYTQAVYPVTQGEAGMLAHAWEGCPQAAGSHAVVSLEQVDAGGFVECSSCEFSSTSLGKVAAASSSIDNGFEYHYRQLAESARDYERALDELRPLTQEVRSGASALFDVIAQALEESASRRIHCEPPGSCGAYVLVVSSGNQSLGFQSSFVASPNALGARVALSAATLIEEPATGERSAVSSLLDGFAGSESSAFGAARIALTCWSKLLYAYEQGSEALSEALEQALDAIPLMSASGLGVWAAGALQDAFEQVGLQSAKTSALKPVVVNSAHVAAQDTSAFAAELLHVKQVSSATAEDFVAALVGPENTQELTDFVAQGGRINIVSLRLFEPGGPELTFALALPQLVTDAIASFLSMPLVGLFDFVVEPQAVRVWK